VENYTTRLHHRTLVYNHDVQAGGAVPRSHGGLDRPGRVETVLDRDSVTVPARQRGGWGHQDHGRSKGQGGSNEGSDGGLGQIHGVVSFRWSAPIGAVLGWLLFGVGAVGVVVREQPQAELARSFSGFVKIVEPAAEMGTPVVPDPHLPLPGPRVPGHPANAASAVAPSTCP